MRSPIRLSHTYLLSTCVCVDSARCWAHGSECSRCWSSLLGGSQWRGPICLVTQMEAQHMPVTIMIIIISVVSCKTIYLLHFSFFIDKTWSWIKTIPNGKSLSLHSWAEVFEVKLFREPQYNGETTLRGSSQAFSAGWNEDQHDHNRLRLIFRFPNSVAQTCDGGEQTWGSFCVCVWCGLLKIGHNSRLHPKMNDE